MRTTPVLFALGLLFFLSPSCTLMRTLGFNFSGVKDERIFSNRQFEGGSTSFQFIENQEIEDEFRVTSHENRFLKLAEILPKTPTLAFLIIRNDSLIFEKYFHRRTENSRVPSFSVSKSFVSALVGIAIEEGKIQSIEDSMTQYLPQLQNKGLENIKIRHLLQMTSGLYSKEGYFNPFSGAAQLYYTRNLSKLISKTKSEDPPGIAFDYISLNTQLLGMILSKATGQTLSEYLNDKIMQHLQPEYAWSWSLDSKKGNTEKAFCCLNATARDFAKFGKLFLQKGNWNGKQLIPQSWVEASTSGVAFEGGSIHYKYQWWIPSKQGDFAARGLHGQYIYVNPAQKMVIVRLGKAEGKENWMKIFREIAGYRAQPIQNQ